MIIIYWDITGGICTPTSAPSPVPLTPIPSLAPTMPLDVLPNQVMPTIPALPPLYIPTIVPTMSQHDPQVNPPDAPLLDLPQRPAPMPEPKSKRRPRHKEPVVSPLDRSKRSSRNSCGYQDSRTVRAIPSANSLDYSWFLTHAVWPLGHLSSMTVIRSSTWTRRPANRAL